MIMMIHIYLQRFVLPLCSPAGELEGVAGYGAPPPVISPKCILWLVVELNQFLTAICRHICR